MTIACFPQPRHLPDQAGTGARCGRGALFQLLRPGDVAVQDLLGVARSHVTVGRRLQSICRIGGAHDVWGHDDHELGFIVLKRGGAEERAEHRHIAEPRELVEVLRDVVLQKTGDCETLAAG